MKTMERNLVALGLPQSLRQRILRRAAMTNALIDECLEEWEVICFHKCHAE